MNENILLSPTTCAKLTSNIIWSNIMHCDEKKYDKYVNLIVNNKDLQMKVGTNLKDLTHKRIDKTDEMKSHIYCNKNNYEICSYSDDLKIEISTPFSDITSIGNELSLWCLLNNNAITIRCSSIIVNDTLIIFCGQSNAGKTTLVRKSKDYLPNAQVISDDHLIVESSKKMESQCMAPIWDERYDFINPATYKFTNALIVILDELITDAIGLWDLFPHIIGLSFTSNVNIHELILSSLDALNIKIAKGKPRDYEYNYYIVKNILFQ